MSTQPTRVIVTDGFWRKSLSAVRSLGKSGFSITVMGDSRFTTSFWSRYTQYRILAPVAANSPEGFGKALLKALESSVETIILPMEDATITWISQNLEQINRLNGLVLIPSETSLMKAHDKGMTISIASELKIPCPQTFQPNTPEEFITQLNQCNLAETIVKPRSGTGSFGFRIAQDIKQNSDSFWNDHWSKFGPLLIQDRIPLEGTSKCVSLLLDENSQPVANFVHERLREFPLGGGPSTDRKSIHSPELVNLSLKLLQHLKWKGIAMVEWKVDPRDGQPKLMEINPRFWGSLELAVRSGVDFPTLYAKLLQGQRPTDTPDYTDGIRCRWMIPGEILRYVSQPKNQREPLKQFLKGLPSLAEEWDTDDLDGFVSTVVCTGVKAFHPDNWKYIGPR